MYINTETASVTLTFEIGALFYTASVTLIFKIGAWFFRATWRIDMLNTCVILFENPSKRELQTRHEWLHFSI